MLRAFPAVMEACYIVLGDGPRRDPASDVDDVYCSELCRVLEFNLVSQRSFRVDLDFNL